LSGNPVTINNQYQQLTFTLVAFLAFIVLQLWLTQHPQSFEKAKNDLSQVWNEFMCKLHLFFGVTWPHLKQCDVGLDQNLAILVLCSQLATFCSGDLPAMNQPITDQHGTLDSECGMPFKRQSIEWTRIGSELYVILMACNHLLG